MEKKIGRPPVVYDPALKERALSLVSDNKTLKQICDDIGVCKMTLDNWLINDPSFASRFHAARDAALEHYADRLLTVATDEPDVMRARLHSENWRWLLSRRLRKRYGDSIDVNVTERVDVGSVLAEARSRLRPMRDLTDVEDAEIVSNQALSSPRSTDIQSDDHIDDLLS